VSTNRVVNRRLYERTGDTKAVSGKIRPKAPHIFHFSQQISRLHRLFLVGTSLVVWCEHGNVFRAAGYSFELFLREALAGFAALEAPARSVRRIPFLRSPRQPSTSCTYYSVSKMRSPSEIIWRDRHASLVTLQRMNGWRRRMGVEPIFEAREGLERQL
jgi:hypothetical protein